MDESKVFADFAKGTPRTVAPPRPPTRCVRLDCNHIRIEHKGGSACSECDCDRFVHTL